uniref:hypothetical protein n=1 Tax=Ruegeria arenilitoris TaxID=1173585 RepID=UPI001481057B
LRNLNASNAAAAAFQNASANSNVGKIATYQEAASEYYDLREDLYDTRRDLRELNESYDGRSSEEIADDIAALDPTDPDYNDTLDSLEEELRDAEAYEEERDAVREDIISARRDAYEAKQDAEAAFFDASKGRTLTRDALGEFHENLDLPQPRDRYRGDLSVENLPAEDAYPERYVDDIFDDLDDVLEEELDRRPNRHGQRRYDRDPLVAAITDPYGSDKLRNLNASNAAAAAFQNASANSNVGKIATYQEAASEYYDLREDLYDTRRDLRELNESYDGRSSEEIADDIAALDPTDPDYNDTLDSLEEELRDALDYEDARDSLRSDVRDLRVDTLVAQKEAEHAFFEASRGTVLTEDSLAELHGNLQLPIPAD